MLASVRRTLIIMSSSAVIVDDSDIIIWRVVSRCFWRMVMGTGAIVGLEGWCWVRVGKNKGGFLGWG